MSSVEKESVEHAHHKTASSTSDRESGLDLEYESVLIHKVDRHLLPILGALYSVALIDRTNMSNAAIAGMARDLVLIKNRYSIALMVFFIPYFIFELPSNLVLRKVGAAKWLGSIALAWGAVMIGMGFVKDWRWLTVCRTILGVFEAGFFPGCVYLVSCWYMRFEVQKRMAGFYLFSVMIGGFSSILAYGLMQMEGTQGLRGWRWIFIIEGVITCAIALLAYVVIIDFPDKVLQSRNGNFLSASDVDILKARIDRDRDDSVPDAVTWANVKIHLCDFKIWFFALLFMCSTMPSYALSYFMPQIMTGMGYSAGMAQILTAPPYVFACISGFSFAIVGDRLRTRGPIIVTQAIICITGLAMTAYCKGNAARYVGTFLGLAGAQGNVPAILSYQSNNIRTNSKRSVASALQVGFGAIGGIFASNVFRSQDAPRYVPGLWATIACQITILLVVSFLSVYFLSENKKQREGKVLEQHADFTYTL